MNVSSIIVTNARNDTLPLLLPGKVIGSVSVPAEYANFVAAPLVDAAPSTRSNSEVYSDISTPPTSPNLSATEESPEFMPSKKRRFINFDMSAQKNKRQRIGPSCDNCRLKKIKCNAEVIIVGTSHAGLTQHDISQLVREETELEQAEGPDGSFKLVRTDDKIVKFKTCLNCNKKGMNCCFSKGYTRDDVSRSNKFGTLKHDVLFEYPGGMKTDDCMISKSTLAGEIMA